ncbi:sodium:solute symporter [Burkholderia multivorans]|uniref:sodium:solute symporter n=1 Tax=Burkholderia multivorans TaxID=87883 RepID=UPI0020B2CC21|nr:sodium:solute symporter [Burkholderia multivorans]
MAIHSGMAGSLYAVVTALGMLTLAVAAPTLWRGRQLIWDEFGQHYGSVVRKLVAFLSLFWMSGVLAAQIHGGIAVLVAAGFPASRALIAIAIALLVMSSIDLGMAAMFFALCLLGTNLALLHALVESNGLYLYLHAWPSFIHEVYAAPQAETWVTIAAVGFLVVTGSDYQQFVIAARQPAHAWIGCVLASVFLTVTGFLPAATVVAALHAGKLSGLTDTASVIPWIMLHTNGKMGLPCIGVILLAALGSGTAVARAMTCALQGLLPNTGRHGFAWRILIIVTGFAIATDGQAIVSTIVSLNIVYVSAVGLLFVLHQTGRQVPPRCASIMLLSGSTFSLLAATMHWKGTGNVPSWLPFPAGLAASACVLLGWHFALFRRRARSQGL